MPFKKYDEKRKAVKKSSWTDGPVFRKSLNSVTRFQDDFPLKTKAKTLFRPVLKCVQAVILFRKTKRVPAFTRCYTLRTGSSPGFDLDVVVLTGNIPLNYTERNYRGRISPGKQGSSGQFGTFVPGGNDEDERKTNDF
ncbi:hypothetical protein Trydic_g12747 [Trypoxylus dichotomus]